MKEIYIITKTTSDCDCSFTKPCSAWTNKKDAELEKKHFEDQEKECEKKEKIKLKFCQNCPIYNVNINKADREKLVKNYCDKFEGFTFMDTLFCSNEFNRYDSEYLGDTWYTYNIEKIVLDNVDK